MKTTKLYIRDEKRNPIGVVVAVNDGGETRFGYALCNPCDQFDKKLGTQIAINRATHKSLSGDQHLVPLVADRREKVCQAYETLAKELVERMQHAE